MGADVVGWRLYAFYPHFTLVELCTERIKHRLHALFIGGVVVLYRRIAEPSFLIALPSLLSPISHELVIHKTPEVLDISSSERSHPLSKAVQVSTASKDATRHVTPRRGPHCGPQE